MIGNDFESPDIASASTGSETKGCLYQCLANADRISLFGKARRLHQV
jgi:hypothetical protein